MVLNFISRFLIPIFNLISICFFTTLLIIRNRPISFFLRYSFFITIDSNIVSLYRLQPIQMRWYVYLCLYPNIHGSYVGHIDLNQNIHGQHVHLTTNHHNYNITLLQPWHVLLSLNPSQRNHWNQMSRYHS